VVPVDSFSRPFASEERRSVVIVNAALCGDFSEFQDDFGLLGKHLGHTQPIDQGAEKRLEHFRRRLFAADGGPELVEFPSYDRRTG
jgi:hypothetical protein